MAAVIGNPLAHSLSPQLHNPALEACGIDAQYIRIHVPEQEFAEGHLEGATMLDFYREDFREQFEMLSEQLETLNAQARELEETIAANVAEILEA